MSVLKVGAIQPNSGTKVNITGSTLLVTTASGHFSGSYEGDGSRLSGVAGFPFTGSGTVSGSLLVTGSSTLALRVSGSTALTGSLLQSGSTHITGSNIVSGSLLVTGSSTAALRISGSSAFTGSIFQSGSNNITGSQKVSGSLLITGSSALALRVSGSTTLTGSLFVSGTVSGSFTGDGSLLTGVVASGSIQSSSVADRATTAILIPVTVVDDGGNKYAFNGVTAPTVSIKRGSVYRFDQSDSSNNNHPLRFRLRDNTSYTPGVTAVGTPGQAGAYTQFDVNFATSASLKYYCTVHGNGMGNNVQVLDLFNGISSGSFSGSFQGDGSELTGVGAFPFTGSGTVSGSLLVTGSSTLAFRVSGSSAFTGSLFVSGAVSASAGFSGSFVGDGSGLTDLAGGGPFSQTGSFFATSNDIQITGSLNATSLTETSALRYKKYVKPLRSQSDNIYKLRPVHFKWKDNNREDIGLIAEEVGKVYPELVSTGINGSAEGISYTKLTAVLIKTIQELSARIDKLENK